MPARKLGFRASATLVVAWARSAGERCGPPRISANTAASASVNVQFGVSIRSGTRHLENPAYPIQERSVGGCQSENRLCCPPALQFGKRGCIAVSIAANFDRQIIAAMLAFFANTGGDPPDRRMVEENCLRHSLKKIHQIIVTPNVREFMSENRLHLPGR